MSQLFSEMMGLLDPSKMGTWFKVMGIAAKT